MKRMAAPYQGKKSAPALQLKKSIKRSRGCGCSK